MSMFFALRGMAELPVESMKNGGLSWFTDLTIAVSGPHNVEKLKIYCHSDACHPRKISSNQLYSIFFSKSVTFTKFLLMMCDSKFP